MTASGNQAKCAKQSTHDNTVKALGRLEDYAKATKWHRRPAYPQRALAHQAACKRNSHGFKSRNDVFQRVGRIAYLHFSGGTEHTAANEQNDSDH